MPLDLYPLPVDEAQAIALQLGMNFRRALIAQSRYTAYLFSDANDAMLFRLRFDAGRWPAKSDDLNLMFLEPTADSVTWINECGSETERVEITAIQFASEEDRERFEGVFWSQPASEEVWLT